MIEAENLDLALKPGMTASVRIRTGRVEDTLRVPAAALRFSPPQRIAPRASAAARRCERSRRITTNLAYKQWGTVFGDAPCLGALVDRFAQHCHVFDIDADSWCEKERKEGLDNKRSLEKRR